MVNYIKNESLIETGLVLKAIRFSIKDSSLITEIGTFFRNELTKTGRSGKGIMSYQGRENANGSLFLGQNTKLQLTMLIFKGSEGLELLDKFRKDFLNLTVNSDKLQNIMISSVDASFIQYKPAQLHSVDDFINLISNAVNVQQKTIPKVSIVGTNLYIGGKSGACSLHIYATLANDLTVKYVNSHLKLKDKSCKVFYQTLLNSIDADTSTVLANAIISQIARVTQTPFLAVIVKVIAKRFEVGKVIVTQQELKKATTSGGKYMIRSLSGIKGKIYKDNSFNNEAQNIFISWLLRLEKPEKPYANTVIPDLADFKTKITTAINQWTISNSP